MSITDGTILRIVASMLWVDGNVVQNVFNAVVTGAGAPWDVQDIIDDAEAWMDNMYANITSNINDELDGNTVYVYEYDPVDDDWDEVGSNTWGWNPTSVGEQLPRAVAGLINYKTTDPDVSGKKYIAGLNEPNIDDGLWNAGTITNLLAFATDMVTPFIGGTSGATWSPGVWSVLGTVFKAAIDAYGTTTIPAYQRRRKRNIGI